VDIKNMVEQIRSGKLPATRQLDSPGLVKIANEIFLNAKIRDVMVLLNRIKGEEVESYIKGKLLKNGIEPIGTIYDDASIALSWLKEEHIKYDKTNINLERVIKKIG
jgi:hypothetical protein